MSLNPRYVNYCRFMGHTPEMQKRIDAQLYPGGKMCGFILHNEEMWRRFWKETGKPEAEWPFKSTPRYAAEFDEWLTKESCMTGKARLAYVDVLSEDQIALLAEMNAELKRLGA